MTKSTLVLQRGKNNNWVKGRETGGMCFTLSYNRLETILISNGDIKKDEMVDRLQIDEYGITVFIEKKK